MSGRRPYELDWDIQACHCCISSISAPIQQRFWGEWANSVCRALGFAKRITKCGMKASNNALLQLHLREVRNLFNFKMRRSTPMITT